LIKPQRGLTLNVNMEAMKKILFVAVTIFILGCKNKEAETFGRQEENIGNEGEQAVVQSPEELGEAIFNGKGNCITCHQVDKKVIGPSVQEIAAVYKAKGGNIIAFLKEDAEPLVDPSQYEVMRTNFGITKAMSDVELKGLEAYIYSNLK
jgi:cytochrome c